MLWLFITPAFFAAMVALVGVALAALAVSIDARRQRNQSFQPIAGEARLTTADNSIDPTSTNAVRFYRIKALRSKKDEEATRW